MDATRQLMGAVGRAIGPINLGFGNPNGTSMGFGLEAS